MDDLFDYAARVQQDATRTQRRVARRRRLTFDEIRDGKRGAGDDPEAIALYLDVLDNGFLPRSARRKRKLGGDAHAT